MVIKADKKKTKRTKLLESKPSTPTPSNTPEPKRRKTETPKPSKPSNIIQKHREKRKKDNTAASVSSSKNNILNLLENGIKQKKMALSMIESTANNEEIGGILADSAYKLIQNAIEKGEIKNWHKDLKRCKQKLVPVTKSGGTVSGKIDIQKAMKIANALEDRIKWVTKITNGVLLLTQAMTSKRASEKAEREILINAVKDALRNSNNTNQQQQQQQQQQNQQQQHQQKQQMIEGGNSTRSGCVL